MDAIDGIVAAARDHRVVAIGEIHRSARIHAFLRSLLADPRLPGLVNDIAVEFGATENQGIVDRYVSGAEVSHTELSRVWAETSQTSGVWDFPIYAQFFEAVRQVNVGLPPDRRFRVLLTDTATPPTECSDPSTCAEDLVDRDARFAQVVEEQSLSHDGRHALLIAGVAHFLRGQAAYHQSVTDRLEASRPGSTFVVVPHEGPVLTSNLIRAAVKAWPVPSLAVLAGSVVGAQPSALLHGDLIVICDHPPCETPNFVGRIQDVADAYLYLGP